MVRVRLGKTIVPWMELLQVATEDSSEARQKLEEIPHPTNRRQGV
jgi:hypothetical protein